MQDFDEWSAAVDRLLGPEPVQTGQRPAHTVRRRLRLHDGRHLLLATGWAASKERLILRTTEHGRDLEELAIPSAATGELALALIELQGFLRGPSCGTELDGQQRLPGTV